MASKLIETKNGFSIYQESPSEFKLVKPGGLTISCTSLAYAKEEMEKGLKRQEGKTGDSAFTNGRRKAELEIMNKVQS